MDGAGDAFQTEGREQAKAWRRDGTSHLARRLAPPTTPPVGLSNLALLLLGVGEKKDLRNLSAACSSGRVNRARRRDRVVRGASGVSADVRARQGSVDTGARATREAVGVLGRVYPAVFLTLRLLSRKLRHGKGCVV